ncbi:MAG TPA: hypothetical protein VKA87_04510 [Nitrososphaeraceae archaeon]|nr:hypothetical protein [Nitrososphaeraceae archaeon]
MEQSSRMQLNIQQGLGILMIMVLERGYREECLTTMIMHNTPLSLVGVLVLKFNLSVIEQ